MQAKIKLFLVLIASFFMITANTYAKADYYYYYDEPCDFDGYWVQAPVYHSCHQPKKKHVTQVKKPHIKKHYRYYQTVIVPVVPVYYVPSCGGCYDCCDSYNPDLTTGDDDPSIYPDLDIDR